jgi:4-hydroxy-3-methylbut-2-enyl diphosphate reductase
MKVLLASPRGFCAGVEMAVLTLDIALKRYGSPLYVFHEIVHNQVIVDSFEKRGVVFVNSVSEVPSAKRLIFSAHGVSPQIRK